MPCSRQPRGCAVATNAPEPELPPPHPRGGWAGLGYLRATLPRLAFCRGARRPGAGSGFKSGVLSRGDFEQVVLLFLLLPWRDGGRCWGAGRWFAGG